MTKGPELKRLRNRFSISRRQVSELAGVSELTVYRYEEEMTKPHGHIEKRLRLISSILEKKENESE